MAFDEERLELERVAQQVREPIEAEPLSDVMPPNIESAIVARLLEVRKVDQDFPATVAGGVQ